MLFCKSKAANKPVFECTIEAGQQLVFRSLVLQKDLPLLSHWASQPKQELQSFYRGMLRNPDAHAFVGLLDTALICQIDVYRAQAADLGNFISCQGNDCSLRFLLAPTASTNNGLSRLLLRSFLAYYFSFPQAARIYAEPGIHDHNACRLLEQSGFRFLQNIMLSDKAASLYVMTKQAFEEG